MTRPIRPLQKVEEVMLANLRVFLVIALCGFALTVHSAEPAGVVDSLRGEARASNPQQPERSLEPGDPVYVQDTILTGPRSQVRITLSDGSRLDFGPRAQMRIAYYATGEQGREPSMAIRILRGAFRFVSGFVADRHPEAVRVELSVATIGIRGTHVGGEVTETSARVMLLEPEKEGSTAIDVFNDYGRVTIDRPGYGTDIPDPLSPPSPVRRMQLRAIDNLMRTMQSIQRARPRIRY